ncbi:TPA: hypothetical protein QFT23_000982 [Bacillus cereus]|nr:hypothetical protein [Bacillus cereus]
MSDKFKTISFEASKNIVDRIESLQVKYKRRFGIPINQSQLLRLLIEQADFKKGFFETINWNKEPEFEITEADIQYILNSC